MKPTYLALVILAACGSDDDGGSSFEISSEPLAGTIDGSAWSFVAGDTDAFLSDGEDDFFATLYPETYEMCGFSFPDSEHLILSVPKEVGDYPLSLSLNMTFVVRDENDEIDNLVATRGRLVVSTVTATSITGGIHAKYDDDNEVDGLFALTICEE